MTLDHTNDFDKDECWEQVEGPTNTFGKPLLSKNLSIEAHRYNYMTERDADLGTKQIVCICRTKNCINPYHYEERKSLGGWKDCSFCGRKTRPWGVKKENAPDTLASAGALCQTCYKAGYGYIGSDYGSEELSEEQCAVVRRTVPRDLWSYFDVT